MRIVIADDHTLMRKALCALLVQQPDMEIIGEAEDGKAAVEMAADLTPDVVLMDFSMPVMNGLDATKIIHSRCPGVCVIGLSMFQHAEQGKPMLAAGASAYVSKSDPPDVLLRTIRHAYAWSSATSLETQLTKAA